MNNRRKMIGMLFASYPSSGESRSEIEQQIALYELALEGVSDANVEMACKAFIQGRVEGHNPSFRPRPPELAEYARRKQDRDNLLEFREQQRMARLAASEEPTPTPDQRARVMKAVNAAKSAISKKVAEDMIGKAGF